MIEMGKNHANYLPSSILSKKIKKFHDSGVVNFLKTYSMFNQIDNE
jgi:hypothetical protein